jgi:hypothetical protein
VRAVYIQVGEAACDDQEDDTRRTCGSLLALEVYPRVAMQILRHSKIAITMEIYTMMPDKTTRAVLKRLSDALGSSDTTLPDDAG